MKEYTQKGNTAEKDGNPELFPNVSYDADFRIIALPSVDAAEKLGKSYDKTCEQVDEDVTETFCDWFGPMDEDAPGFENRSLGEWDWTVFCDMKDCDKMLIELSREYPDFGFAAFYEPLSFSGKTEEEREEFAAAKPWKREYFRGAAYENKNVYYDDTFDYDICIAPFDPE